MKRRSAIFALICLAASWYYALTLASIQPFPFTPAMVNQRYPLVVVNNFYPLWNASRSVLHRMDPYAPEATEQNEIAAYGMTAKALGIRVRQRFAYPVYATFPVLPLGLLPFAVAKWLALFLFAALVVPLVGWLRGEWDGRTVLLTILAFASYPTIYALQECHPTLLFFGLAVMALALLRSKRLVAAGVVAALAFGKPHVALPLLLPMLIWAAAGWCERKRFVISLAASSAVFVGLATILVPGWIPEWLAAVHAYAEYIYPSFVVLSFGHKLGPFVAAGLFVGLIAVLWRHRQRDLLFQAAVCAPIVYLITPYVVYNAVLLLIPAVWIADNSSQIKEGGAISEVALSLVQVAFAVLLVAAPVGALLLHSSAAGKKAALAIGGIVVSPLLISVAAVMVAQCFTFQPSARTVPVATPESSSAV